MKIIPPLFLIIFLSGYAQAQQQFDSDNMMKLEKATRQKKTGAVLTAAGGVLLGVGLIVGLNSSETTTYNNGAVTQSSTGNLGLAQTSLLLGLAGLGAGIPIWSVGAHRVKKLNSEGVSLSLSPHVNGLTLRLRF